MLPIKTVRDIRGNKDDARETAKALQLAAEYLGPDEVLPGFKRPAERFKDAETELWLPLITALASRSLPYRDIAGICRCHPRTLQNNVSVQDAVRQGHAAHKLMVEQNLYLLATADVSLGADSIDKASIRQTKLKALQILKGSLDGKDKFIPPEEQERLRRMSDEELTAAIKDAAAKLQTTNFTVQ